MLRDNWKKWFPTLETGKPNFNDYYLNKLCQKNQDSLIKPANKLVQFVKGRETDKRYEFHQVVNKFPILKD